MRFRDATEEDLKDLKFKSDEPCAVCDLDGKETIGSYRLTDWYACKKCCLRDMMYEVEDGLNKD